MKTAILCVVCGAAAFLGMLVLMLSAGSSETEPEIDETVLKDTVPALKPARFPEDLAPAARGSGVLKAAAFALSTEPHPTAVLDGRGRLHPWHERQKPGWRADTVEATELVLLLSDQRKTLLQTITYRNGAPSVNRYRHEIDATIVEAKTGRTLTSKRFESVARPIAPVEVWDLTELGDPVEPREVNQWLTEFATRRAQDMMLEAEER